MTTTFAGSGMTRRRVRLESQRTWMPVRWALALVLAATGVGLIIIERSARALEALVASEVIPLLFASDAVRAVSQGDPAFAFGYGEHWYALVITAECSIAFYVGAILIISAAVMLVPRIRMARVITAALICAALMIALNQVRFAGLAYVRGEFGAEAYAWAHTLYGSILMLVGLGACVMFFLFFVVRSARRGGRES